MKKLMIIVLLLLVSPLAAARVFMCVDATTGKTSFTDTACNVSEASEEVRVSGLSSKPGSRKPQRGEQKAWNSDLDRRKSGLDFNAERRRIYQGTANASTR